MFINFLKIAINVLPATMIAFVAVAGFYNLLRIADIWYFLVIIIVASITALWRVVKSL